MSTIRVHKRTDYSSIPNSIFRDGRLSFRALGILTYLLSKPDDWVVNVVELKRSHTEGRDALRAGLQELVVAGYLQRSLARGDRGVISGARYELSEIPFDSSAWDSDKNAASPVRKPGDGFPGAGAGDGTQNGTAAWKSDVRTPSETRPPADGKPGAGFPGALPIPEFTQGEREENEKREENKSKSTGFVRRDEQNAVIPLAPATNGTRYSTEFDIWWMCYGRKGNKFAAFKRWNSSGAVDVPVEEVVEGTKRYLAYLETEGRPQQDAERWLHDRGWESEWKPAPLAISKNGHQPKTFTQRRVENTKAAISEFERMMEEQDRAGQEDVRVEHGAAEPLLRARVDAGADGDVLRPSEEQRRHPTVPSGGGPDH